MGCHGNHAILNDSNVFFYGDNHIVSHVDGPTEQFDTHKILS